ncbi:MAG: 2-C-methyl-D-erythritol 2,4-cyclodiphosphate synthase [bacterium]
MSSESNPPFRIGLGYDVHRWADNRDLILGGVRISHTAGLLGHSDADVLTHAVMDALLGSVNLGDIGQHFLDTDNRYKDARSVLLLEQVVNLVKKEGYVTSNVDCVVVAEEPKISPHIASIRESLAKHLRVSEHCVSVKATTTEGLLHAGPSGGMACYAVVLVAHVEQKNGGKL